MAQHMHSAHARGSAHLSRQLAVALAGLVLVIASTIVHSDDYRPPAGPYGACGSSFQNKVSAIINLASGD
jgi:tRNA C32,U32 (ribose-2'-O)-methylase TrmJ